MTTQLKISDAEWEVMKTIWEKSPLTSSEIVEKLSDKHDWSPRTIKTMLSRLTKKEAITFVSEGKSYLYSPAVDQSQCIKAESRSFLDKVFNGSAAPMLAYFVKNSQLSEDEIAELKKILDEKENN